MATVEYKALILRPSVYYGDDAAIAAEMNAAQGEGWHLTHLLNLGPMGGTMGTRPSVLAVFTKQREVTVQMSVKFIADKGAATAPPPEDPRGSD